MYAAISILAPCLMLSGDAPASIQQAEVVARAAEANRRQFPFGTLTFRAAFGTADTIADALNGKSERRTETLGSCCYDGERARYECVYTLEQQCSTRRPLGNGYWETPATSWRHLTDGADTLFHQYSPRLDGEGTSELAQITRGTSPLWSTWSMPLEIGKPETKYGVAAELAKIGGEKEDVKLTRLATATGDEGRHLLDLTFTGVYHAQTEWQRETRIRVDLDRGAIPVEVRTEYSKPRRIVHCLVYDDIRPVPDRGWLPYRMLEYSEEDHRFREWVILDADFERRPAASQFRLTFERPIAIYDQVRSVSYEPTQSFSFQDRPRVQSGSRTSSSSGASAPMLPGETEPGRRWPYLMAGIGVALFSAFAIRRGRA